MSSAPLTRPLAGLKTLVRRARQQRHLGIQHARFASTSNPTSTSTDSSPSLTAAKYKLFQTATKKNAPYAVYTSPITTHKPTLPPSISTAATEPAELPPKNPLPSFHATQIARLDPTGARTALFSRTRLDRAKVGDVLLVTLARGDPFAGVLVQIRRRGVETAISLRGQLMKVGVEMWFKIYSPTVAGIDVVWRRPRRARRARLTYLRKPKHDMGSVDHLVAAWRRERSRLRQSQSNAGRRNIGSRF